MRKELAEWKLNVDKDKGKGGKKGKGKVICDVFFYKLAVHRWFDELILSACSVFFPPCKRKGAKVARRRRRRKI